MADDRHYVPGDFYRVCDRTGFKVRSKRTAKEWTGRIVRGESWEVRHPQDFVRGITDDQTVPDPRPRQTDVFTGPLQTTVGRNAKAGDVLLNVVSSVRMQIGDRIAIVLDNKDVFLTTITSLPGFSSGFSSGFASGLGLAKPLPYSVAFGNVVTDYTALSLPFLG